MSPAAVRWVILAGLLVAAFSAGAMWNGDRVYRLWLDERGKQAAAAVKIIAKQGEVTERVVVEYRDRVVKGATVTKTIHDEVTKYVEGKPLALACMLDERWVQLHDAAARGDLPPAASGTDGSPGGITAAAALPTITENYARANRNKDRLTALQKWADGQSKVRP